MKNKLDTKNVNTWCPGCPNFLILEAVKKAFARVIGSGTKQEEIAIATGIGCHGKMYDYLNVSGVYALHGRVLPVCLGMKLGNPNLVVVGFGGDGDTYAEGMAHFIHACRYNADMTMVVHDNRAFSLTTGQPTPTSQQGYESKASPLGVVDEPINPVKLALCAGATFIARCNAKDIEHTAQILEKAIKHKGFSFVEILQDCLVFNLDVNNLDKMMYKVDDNKDKSKALALVDEWNYNTIKSKIPVGILYSAEKKTLVERHKISKK